MAKAVVFKDGGILFIDGAIQFAEDACDCCATDVEDCGGFADCVQSDGGFGDPVNRGIDVTFSDISDNGCADCEMFNTTFGIASGSYIGSPPTTCGAIWTTGGSICTDYDIEVSINVTSGTPPSVAIQVQLIWPGGGGQIQWGSSDALTLLNQLCSGSQVEIPLSGDVGNSCGGDFIGRCFLQF